MDSSMENFSNADIAEAIQRMAVRVVATNSAGRNLWLVGGFRFRLVDQSARRSLDLDYNCFDDLESRQKDLVALFRKKLLLEVRARFGFEGTAQPAAGPDSDSAFVKTVDLAFWKTGVSFSRIEIPVDLTRIPCLDPPQARTLDGSVCLVASDADMIESKVLALFGRALLAPRDLVDLFLFSDKFVADSPARLKRKLDQVGLGSDLIHNGYRRIVSNRASIERGIAQVLETQVDPATVDNLRAAGGAEMLFSETICLVRRQLGIEEEGRP